MTVHPMPVTVADVDPPLGALPEAGATQGIGFGIHQGIDDIDSSSRSRSGLAPVSRSSAKRPQGDIVGSGHRVALSRMILVGLFEIHAVAAFRSVTTRPQIRWAAACTPSSWTQPTR